MIAIETITLRRSLGRAAILVTVIRRNCRRTRKVARAMLAAGKPRAWIASALRISRAAVDRLLEADPVWGRALLNGGARA